MIDPLDTLRPLLAGAPGGGGLLPACTAQAFGAEAFGPAMIAELFARHPQPLSPTPHLIRTSSGLAVFDSDDQEREQILIADLYDGRIGRLWRVGGVDKASTPDPVAEPSLGVAYDPFLTQQRRPVAVPGSEHTELDKAATPALTELGRDLGESRAGALALGVRAFGAEGRAAALFALHSNTGDVVREARATLAAAIFRYGPDGALLHRRVVIEGAAPPARLARLAPTPSDVK